MAYSMVDLTKEMYAVFLQSLGQYLRFLLRKQSVELAFLVTLVMCVVHLRSSDICSPRYGLFCTFSSLVTENHQRTDVYFSAVVGCDRSDCIIFASSFLN